MPFSCAASLLLFSLDDACIPPNTTLVRLQVERDNLYSAFYKLTDSSRQITSFVYDCSTPPLCMLAAKLLIC